VAQLHFSGKQVMILSNEIHGLASNELLVEIGGAESDSAKKARDYYLDELVLKILRIALGRKHTEN